MSRVRRIDYVAQSELAPPVRLDNGFLKAQGRIARTGIQVYYDSQGRQRRELRLPEEVFDKESLESFEQLPVTNNHPTQMLDARNAKEHTVGNVSDLRRDGDYVAATIMLIDAEAIAAAESGRSQLSNGYTCEMDETQDPKLVELYGAYDSIQRNIRGNHVALCDNARAGSGAALRLDSGDAVSGDFCRSDGSVVFNRAQEKPTMPHALKVDGLQFEVEDPNIQAAVDRALEHAKKDSADRISKLEKDLAETQAKHASLEAEIKRADAKMLKCDNCGGSGKLDAGGECPDCEGKGEMPAKMDTAERRAAIIKRRVDAAVRARTALMLEAKRHLSAHEKLDDLTDRQIKSLVVVALAPHVKDVIDSRSDDFVNILFESETKRVPVERPIDRVREVQAPNAPKHDAYTVTDSDVEAARKAMIERQNSTFVAPKK